ncbi:uncharacterized protein TNCT_191921 [Trichonephila clavata]|uniref:Uncharacterized protein n=1 Tax=Trichonephila clavata TaxID=2740835 RepID=A0A8X6HPB0_TRICU|nr:uncharacterized protein TNCT_55901 [Trichonephila clavata]GFR13884.1 uncharacterized protein TNCT_226191 [Trichonephila clavata]GFR27003.1 uncharacterized protein TNCT_191921 [Trichonephila clavata]
MIPIWHEKNEPYYTIYIHQCIFPTFFEKYVLNLNIGTRIEIVGDTVEEGYVFPEFKQTNAGFLYNEESDYRVRNEFISKYVSKETGWIMTADDWRDMIYHGFIFSFPSLVIRTTKATIHIQINDEERRMYPLRFSTIAYLEMKPVRRAQSEGKRVFTSLNDIV